MNFEVTIFFTCLQIASVWGQSVTPDPALLVVPAYSFVYLFPQSFNESYNWPEINSVGSTNDSDGVLQVGDSSPSVWSYRFSPELTSDEWKIFRLEIMIETSGFVPGTESASEAGSIIYLAISPIIVDLCKILNVSMFNIFNLFFLS